MKNKILPLISILFINLVSAQFFSGYGRFSIEDLINRTDPQTITLTLIFFGFFIIIFAVFLRWRLFHNSAGEPMRGLAGGAALVASALITFVLYQQGFDLSGFFFDIGFSPDSLYGIFPILFLIVAILVIWKASFRMFLFLTGLILILLTVFTDVFYTKGFTFILGLVLVLISWWLFHRRSMGAIGSGLGRGALATGKFLGKGALARGKKIASKYDWEKSKRQFAAIGRGTIGKTPLGRGRLMSKKRAEEEAYREEAQRQKISRRSLRKRRILLQREYNHHKRTYNNSAIPRDVRNMARAQMQNIAQQAMSEGIRLSY